MISLLIFDYGLTRMGVAFGQTLTGSASPLPTLKMRDGQPQWDEVAALIQRWRPNGILVGIPLHMDGTGSEMAQRSDKFRRRLLGRFGLPALGWDERLTTRELKRTAQAQGITDFKRHALDSEAAVLIFQSWAEALHDEANWQSHSLVWSP